MIKRILIAIISVSFLAGCAAPGYYRKPYKPKDMRAIERKRVDEQKRIIVIDPGHGGKDPGAVGPTGLKEKIVVLDIARRLEKHLKAGGEYEVVLTRSDDRFISLIERREIAQRKKADLFISIHCDGNRNKRWNGTSVYILSEKGARVTRTRALDDTSWQGGRLGAGTLTGTSTALKEIVVDLVQSGSQRESYCFAKLAAESISRELGTKNLGIKEAAFGILKTLEVPSVLVETAFITNWWEEKLLKQPAIREKIARALAGSVREYFAKAD